MNSEQLMNEILALDNIELAVKQVKANKGSAGVDGMKVYELNNNAPRWSLERYCT